MYLHRYAYLAKGLLLVLLLIATRLLNTHAPASAATVKAPPPATPAQPLPVAPPYAPAVALLAAN